MMTSRGALAEPLSKLQLIVGALILGVLVFLAIALSFGPVNAGAHARPETLVQ